MEIGRRVFRNGDSEYFINRAPCRLKDIQDLFVDTGMGADAYSVIELKMIEQILSETTDDRKRMFEEAAGINKYKHQRKATLRKFEAVRTDLERVNDIIIEVEAKVKGLALQLKRFERHEKLSSELRQREIALAFVKIEEFEENAAPLKKKIQDFKHLRESTATEASIHENELDQLKSVYQQQNAELEDLRSTISKEETARDTAQRDVLVASEKRRSSVSTEERLGREKATNENRISQLVQHVKDYEIETEQLLPRIEVQLDVYKQEKSTFETLDRKYKQAQTDVDALQDKRWDEQRKQAEQESLFKRTKDMVSENENRLNGFVEKETSLKNELGVLENNKKSDAKELAVLQKRFEQRGIVLDKVSAAVKILELNEQEAIGKEHSLKNKHEMFHDQIRFYEHLLESKEGIPGGVKHVLDNLKDFSGVYGVLAELLNVDNHFQKVIESVLGSLAGCLVVNDKNTALKILQILKNKKLGSASILPLKELSALGKKPGKIPTSKYVLEHAVNVVTAAKKYDVLVNVLLGQTLIVNDLASAVKDRSLANWDLVDMDGTFAGTNLILKQTKKDKGLVGRKEHLLSLQKQLTDNEKDKNVIKRTLVKISKQLQNAVADKEKTATDLKELGNEVQSQEHRELQQQIRFEQQLDQLNVIKNEMAETKAAISSLKISLNALSPSAEKGEKILSKLAEELNKSNEELIEIRKQRDEFHKQVQDIRIEVLNLENQRDNLQFQKRTAEESVTELTKRQSEINKEIAVEQQLQKDLKRQMTAGEKALTKANAVVSKKRSILDLKKETVLETFNEIESIQTKIREEQHSRESLLDDLKEAELEISEFDQRIKLIIERIKDRYNENIPIEMQVAETIVELEERIEKINRSIENIGPINMAVKDEHDAETERLELLAEQKEDLVESEENLQETIQEIDKEARKLFIETFDQIKINFEKLFAMFFEGGNGSLRLIGDPDPLDADIAIQAQPPGKKNNTLRMLSAGEKSLTAIALLFAIYQFKPSPYCILDEVDAPLDDVNIRKFTKVLEAFADDTQFIVVTHNKLTMEAANYLYGVTMEKKGISKLVSVKFEA